MAHRLPAVGDRTVRYDMCFHDTAEGVVTEVLEGGIMVKGEDEEHEVKFRSLRWFDDHWFFFTMVDIGTIH